VSMTIRAAPFKNINLRERTELLSNVLPGVAQLPVVSAKGHVQGDVIYVGRLSREGCERAVVDVVITATCSL
jgi:hypothetical protein